MSASTTRKRAAPGANPIAAAPIQQQGPQSYATTDDQMMRWNTATPNGNGFTNMNPQGLDDLNSQQYIPMQQQSMYGANDQSQSQHSSAIALRDNKNSNNTNTNNLALVSAAPRYDSQRFDGLPDMWPSNDNALVPAANNRNVDIEAEQQLMEAIARAQKIEEEAKDSSGPNQKRSIPPFVLKLATFLNHNKNSDLIRWSEKGDSFIVLDEDEFARKLIPEMFKHNNYASFVRQLNMYGFHKRVGLSDNSMRASEKKNKSPSEYAHPYFRRGYDVLQWLIQKPQKSSNKRKQGAKRDAPEITEADSDDEYADDQAYAVSGAQSKNFGRSEAGPLAKTEMGKFREQLAQVQQQQKQVLTMIHQLRQTQAQIVAKAQEVEQQHARHETSITAILNFLANVFRKSLEGKSGVENISEILASILPVANHGSMPTTTVQDLGEYADYMQPQAPTRNSASPVPQKRTQHLLPGIPTKQDNPAPASEAHSPAGFPSTPGPSGQQHMHQSSRITEVYDTSPSDTTSPNYYHQELKSNPQETMMKVINNTNARMTPGVDLPEIAASTTVTMPSDQRNHMLNAMSQRTASPANNTMGFTPPSMTPSMTPGTPAHHAQVPLQPAAQQPQPQPQPNSAVSPIMGSIPRGPSMNEIAQQQYNLNDIVNQLSEVDAGINNLASIAGQLSPNGRIPGYDSDIPDNANDYFSALENDPNFDVAQWLNTDAASNPISFDFTDSGVTGGEGQEVNNFDFSVAGVDPAAADTLPAPAPNAQDTPSPAVTEEIQRTDLDGFEMPSSKRQRQV